VIPTLDGFTLTFLDPDLFDIVLSYHKNQNNSKACVLEYVYIYVYIYIYDTGVNMSIFITSNISVYIYVIIYIHMCIFLKCGYHQIFHFDGIFHYKPSSYWGTSIVG